MNGRHDGKACGSAAHCAQCLNIGSPSGINIGKVGKNIDFPYFKVACQSLLQCLFYLRSAPAAETSNVAQLRGFYI